MSPLYLPCASDAHLHKWITVALQLRVPRVPVCPHHDAPFEYLRLAYFEPARDLVVWAPRGGGKTRLAAAATLLDLLHKPPCAVRILGGSLEQSLRMWEHLLPDVERIGEDLLSSRPARSSRRIELTSGSSCAVLSQSQRAVRGLRVQKLRCDEVEMFDPKVWEAAQLATRTVELKPLAASQINRHPFVCGAVEALSTYHRVTGLMGRIVEEANRAGTRVLRWCLLDVLERCPAERDCATCPLWDDCRGVAKERCDGFFKIDDAIAMKKRVSPETWESEMLCKRPSASGRVFPRFDETVHVRELESQAHGQQSVGFTLAIDFGFADPFVCLWVEQRDDGTTYVLDEYVQEGRTVSEHIEHIDARQWGKVKRVCCDPVGAGRNEQTAASNVQLLRASGHTVKTRHSRIVEGLELIRAALRSAAGDVRLHVHPRCKRMIRALQNYHYPLTGGELPLKDGEHDHLIDALRYYFVNTNPHGHAKDRAY
jgi:hypothetical protein